LQEKEEKQKNFVQTLLEQNTLLQERVVALETMIEEQRVTTDTLREQNRLLQERVGALETVIEQQRDSSDTFREQNKLLQERVVALESASKEDGDVAIAKRVDDLKQKLDAHGDSVEEIKSSLIVWALKN
jgi:CHASE3 domain sensor protein